MLKEYLTNIADTLRRLLGTSDTINAQDFPIKIQDTYDEGYASGQQSMIDESKLIPKTVSGERISVDDVSEIPHTVECKVKTINLFDCLNAQRSSSTIGYNFCEIVERTEDSITVRKTTDNLWEFIAFDLPDGLEGKTITMYGEWACSGDNTGMVRIGWNNNFTNSILIQTSGIVRTVAIPDKPEGATNLVLLLYGGSYSGNKGDEVYYKNVMVTVGEWSGKFTPYVSPETVTITKYGSDESEGYQTITPNPDGTVDGMTSVSPYMNILADTEGVTIEATYNKSYGMQTEYDRFWDAYQNNGSEVNYAYAFAFNKFTDATYNPKYDIVSSAAQTALTYAYCDAKSLLDTKVAIHCNTGTLSNMFAGCTNLVTIRKIILNVDTSATTSTFNNCVNIQNLLIEGEGRIAVNISFQWCKLLTHNSLMSIINALSPTTTGRTITFSVQAVQKAFETSEGANDGNTSVEWLNLIATKSNWTITLI